MSEIWKALLEVQKEAPALQRDGLNPHFKSKYVTLETVMATVLPILNRHGVLLIQGTDFDDSGDVLFTKLIHADTGETAESVMRLRVSKDDAQGLGSAMTYARRYAIMGMLGLVADADDDGNAASAPKKPAKKPKADDNGVLPANWQELEALFKPYGQQVWDEWLSLGAVTRGLMFADKETTELSPAEKAKLWDVTLSASQWLLLRFDPEKFPPPSRDEMREAWGFAIGGGVELP